MTKGRILYKTDVIGKVVRQHLEACGECLKQKLRVVHKRRGRIETYIDPSVVFKYLRFKLILELIEVFDERIQKSRSPRADYVCASGGFFCVPAHGKSGQMRKVFYG